MTKYFLMYFDALAGWYEVRELDRGEAARHRARIKRLGLGSERVEEQPA